MPPNNNKVPRITVLFHGLGGSIKSHYIRRMMHFLKEQDELCVLMHFRSCSGEVNTKARSYHAGETDDADFFISQLRQRFPQVQIHAIAYSIGANMLLKYLGTSTSHAICSAVAISPPFELEKCTHHLNKGFSKLYQYYLLMDLKTNLLKKASHIDLDTPYSLSSENIRAIKSIYEFDELYTAPVHGFKDAKEYYRLNSSRKFLKQIKTPTLIIHSMDDPFMPKEVIPHKEELGEYVSLELSKYGGHVGFIQGSLLRPHFWLQQRIYGFLFTPAKD